MPVELEVLGIVSERLQSAGMPFMLTGSFAMAYYGRPRMTRDLDIVVELNEADVDNLVELFASDFYVDADSVLRAIASQQLFNLMHLETSIKVDLIVRKDTEYRRVEFARRRPVQLNGVNTWIVSREDLILSKLVWARDSGSELQRRDVRTLLDDTVDHAYLQLWSKHLNILEALTEINQ